MATRTRFGSNRGRGATLSDSDSRALYPRIGLNEVQRSQSTESYNRRKPVLLSTGTPELAANAVTNTKLITDAVDGRVLKASSIADRHVPDNLVTTRILASGDTDPQRAVGPLHQKTNSTTDRVLASGDTDPQRAVGSAHQKNNSTTNRILDTNATDTRVLKTDGPTDQRAVTEAAARSGFLAARHFRGGDSVNPNRLPDGVKVHLDNDTDGELPIGRTSGELPFSRTSGELPLSRTSGDLPFSRTSGELPLSRTSGELPIRRTSGDMDGSRLARRSVASEKLAGVHGGKLFGRSSISWSLIDVDGVVFWPGLKKYLDANYAKKSRPIVGGGHRH